MPNLFKTPRDSKPDSDLKISVYWGDVLYDTAICKANESVTVGRDRGNTFILDLPAKHHAASFKLVDVSPDHSADLFFDDELSGHVRFGEKLFSLASAKETAHVRSEGNGLYRAKLSTQDKADIVIGHVSFYLDWIDHEERKVVPRSILLTRRQKIASALLLLLAILAFYGIQHLPVPEPEKPPERLVLLMPKNAPAKAAIGDRKSADGGAQTGELGKADLASDQKPSAAAQVQKANLGSLLSGLTSLGGNAPSVKADSQATSAAVSQVGTHGFSTTGMKTGGGGKAIGIGRTVGQGEGGFDGTGRLGLSGDSALEGGTGHGTGEVLERGGLDRDLIDSIIRRRQDRIRLCYERQLNFNPKLSGKVAIHFVIGKDGNVLQSRITEDTMREEHVNSCILSEVKTWTFPKPQGGTQVNVDYPFVFESSAHGSG